ncbi:hypothetical protein Q5752_007039 [Cryptotrichosporon argae]
MDIHTPPEPKPRRKRISAGRCCAYLCAAIGAAVVVLVLGGLGWALWAFAASLRDPHQAHLHDAASAAVSVRPLLGPHDTFDVVLTVWARRPDALQPWYDADEAALEARLKATADPKDVVTQSLTKLPLVEIQNRADEDLLFSSVVFHDFSLSSADREKKVTFELPLQRFYDKRIYTPDVRVALTLLPRPDVLDGLVNVSDWRPYNARPRQRIPNNFVFPSGKVDYAHELQAKAVEMTGGSYGLVRFHDIKSKCAVNTTDDNDSAVDSAATTKAVISEGPGEPAKPPAQHPHIVTRSHFYIMNETRRFDLVAYDKKHNELASTSCGQLIRNARPGIPMCSRTYQANGQWETRLAFAREDGTQDLAYAPFVGWLFKGAGPKHIVPLPVSKEDCADRSNDPETFTVNYTVRLSALTPARVAMIDSFTNAADPDADATAKALIDAHDSWELTAGVLGSRTEGTHPRTRMLVATIHFAAELVKELLNILYWFTRATTAGICVSGTLLLAAGSALDYVGFSEHMWKTADSAGPVVVALALYLLVAVGNVRAGALVLPLEIEWKRWLPVGIRRRRWTHRERVTRRIEQSIPRTVLLAIFSATLFSLYALAWLRVTVVRAAHEHRDPPPPTYLGHDAFQGLLRALRITGHTAQLYTNHAARTFAGSYAATTRVALVARAAQLVHYLDTVVGPVHTREAVYPHEALDFALEAIAAYQGATLPRVEQSDEDGSED